MFNVNVLLLNIFLYVLLDFLPFNDAIAKLPIHDRLMPEYIVDKIMPSEDNQPIKNILFDNPVYTSLDTSETQLTKLKTEKIKQRNINMEFQAHGRTHRLELKEHRQQVQDIQVSIVGFDPAVQSDVNEQLKEVRLMTDARYGSVVAIRGSNNSENPTIVSGYTRLGDNEFSFASAKEVNDDTMIRVEKKTMKRIKRNDMSPSSKRVVRAPQDSKLVFPNNTADRLSVTVELVMVVDYSTYSYMINQKSVAKDEVNSTVSLILYFAQMTQIIDNYYSSMRNNEISISVNLAGLILLAQNSAHTNLVEDHKILKAGNTYIDSSSLLKRLSEWQSSDEGQRVLPPFDHVMLFTKYNMFDALKEDSQGIVGLAYIGKICDKTLSSSIIEFGFLLTFDASTAAHELGHSLGAYHDGSDKTSSAGCSDENYIMAAYSGTNSFLENRFIFSCCSQRSFYSTIKINNASCLAVRSATPNYNSSVSEKVNSTLPGQMFSADDQCYLSYGTKACSQNSDQSICLNLRCVDATDASACETVYTAASDGTSCGTNKWCYMGSCTLINDTKNLIPPQNCKVSDCYAGESRCLAGYNQVDASMLFCYNKNVACDKQEDCSDGTDEKDCIYASCPTSYTACNTGRHNLQVPTGVPQYCLKDDWACDGEADCYDGSDEHSCKSDCYLCANGKCISEASRCVTDCPGEPMCKRVLENSGTDLISSFWTYLTTCCLISISFNYKYSE